MKYDSKKYFWKFEFLSFNYHFDPDLLLNIFNVGLIYVDIQCFNIFFDFYFFFCFGWGNLNYQNLDHLNFNNSEW